MRFKQINPQPAKRYRAYSHSSLTDAYLAVKDGKLAVTRASRQYGIPEQTLRDRVLGKVDIDCVSMGTAPILSMDEEAKIVQHLKSMASYGYGYTRQEVVDVATDYAVQLGKRTHDKPLTLNWFRRFVVRWPELHVLKPRALEQQRAKSASEASVSAYFNELEDIIRKYNLQDKPHLIFNVDEKGVSQNHSPPYVVAKTDFHPQAGTSGKSKTTTIIGCGSASGVAVPPFFVFAGKRMIPELMTGASPGAAGTMTETGWSNSEVFRKYLQEHFMKFIPERELDQHLLLLLDGHKSHISVDLLEWAKANKIILFILPAHTSHILQPLDVSCYGPLQNIYNAQCHKLIRETASAITRYNVCELACKAYTRSLTAENLHSAFRKTGIFPFDRTVISTDSVMPAEVFQKKETLSSENNQDNMPTTEIIENTGPEPPEDEMDITESNIENHTVSPSAFMVSRIEKLIDIKSKVVEKKERKSMSKITSGKPITESVNQNKIIEHQSSEKGGKCSKNVNVGKGGKCKGSLTKKGEGKAGKVSHEKKKFVLNSTTSNSPKPGPSHYYIDSSDTNSDADSDIPDEEKCCVCKLYTPVEVRDSIAIKFTKWVQCDNQRCLHWVHLKYCTALSVIRRGVKFYCQHCEHLAEE